MECCRVGGADPLVRAGRPRPAAGTTGQYLARCEQADEGVGRGPGGLPHLTESQRPGAALSVPHRNLIHHFDAEAFERHDLPRMVGQQADGMQPQIGEYLRADTVLVL